MGVEVEDYMLVMNPENVSLLCRADPPAKKSKEPAAEKAPAVGTARKSNKSQPQVP